ncbi:DNA-protecting protein DprA [Mangrovimicrobium sediminis]|uniref:DNA-protecting protein DprA n=1 Tax=Mangrovimicrobium sediminis TaxID=2562682 RepID=A0A4Z0M070_9GAMM|nr:DNA-processing protein DprA [Haliea sp. SAOS-164]TGD72817.1 DNA-protecting protein DprA [Haliea sp. SAOS-164]
METVDMCPPALPPGTQLILSTDPRFPPLLNAIPDPPARLYLHGDADLLARPQLAIVGARRASAAGLQAAAELARAAVDAGLCVCSGMAQGVDGAAHRAALEAGGPTVAVMGTGIDIHYPKANGALARQIIERGCLVTEYPPASAPEPWRFPRRNRIISGLSLGVVVVEAALRSGSLITASAAVEQGREVFALPWSNAHAGGSGCLRLLRDGAKMVQGIDDILEELDSLYRAQRALTPSPVEESETADGDAPALLTLLGDDEIPADTLAGLTGRPVAEVMAELTALELAGQVRRGAQGYRREPDGRITLPSRHRFG